MGKLSRASEVETLVNQPSLNPVIKQEGVTDAERYLHRLGTRSFLSLWSYPGVFRNQGPTGKEVCDLLVVFGDHVIIFSDKDCAFSGGNLRVAWGRWFRSAIQESAKQVWGAERWIRNNPKRLFLDRACQRPLPIDLPPAERMRIHRVVVAHGTHKCCREHFGGAGTFVLKPSVVGKAHWEGECTPFVIGDIDPAKGFIHVLDDFSLHVVMEHLDTAADFIAYLAKKEAFFRGGKFAFAAGEADLLSWYLQDVNGHEEHDFVFPMNAEVVVVEPGEWERFCSSDAYARQKIANQVSYAWDALIEEFGRHILGGTSVAPSHVTVRDQERAVRLLAHEGRTARRALAKSLLEIIRKTPAGKRGARVMGPPRPGSPYYVFLILPQAELAEEEYRRRRRDLLSAYCQVVKLRFPNAQDIVGIATESADSHARSQDVICLDARVWSEEMQVAAERLHAAGLLKNTGPEQRETVHEYPDA
jgi:hypothetical protein